jgi:hypothetical protein
MAIMYVVRVVAIGVLLVARGIQVNLLVTLHAPVPVGIHVIHQMVLVVGVLAVRRVIQVILPVAIAAVLQIIIVAITIAIVVLVRALVVELVNRPQAVEGLLLLVVIIRNVVPEPAVLLVANVKKMMDNPVNQILNVTMDIVSLVFVVLIMVLHILAPPVINAMEALFVLMDIVLILHWTYLVHRVVKPDAVVVLRNIVTFPNVIIVELRMAIGNFVFHRQKLVKVPEHLWV